MNSELDLVNYPVWYTPFIKTLQFKIVLACFFIVLSGFVVFYILKKRRKKSLPDRLIDNLDKLKHSKFEDIVFVNSEIVNYLKIYLIELNSQKIFQEQFKTIDQELDLDKLKKIDFFSMSEMEIVIFLKDFEEFKIVEPVFKLSYDLKYKPYDSSGTDYKDNIEKAIFFINKTKTYFLQ